MSISVNTKKKADKIISALRKAGRFAIYEEFYTFTGAHYSIYYKAV